MNAAAATAMSSICLFLFNDMLLFLWSFPAAAIRATQPRRTRSNGCADGYAGLTRQNGKRTKVVDVRGLRKCRVVNIAEASLGADRNWLALRSI